MKSKDQRTYHLSFKKKIAQLQNIESTGLKKSDLTYILLRSKKHLEETKYLDYLQIDLVNEIKTKINDIRKCIIELGMLLDKSDKNKITRLVHKRQNYLMNCLKLN